jgi:ketosteroid isomerase-like protein
MAEEANLAVVEAMWLAWNEKRLSDAADSIAKAAHFRHFSLGIELDGREAILNLMEHSLAALPERKSTVLHAHATDDYVITENHYEGVLAETGEPITKDICYIFRLEDGLIVEWREYG